MCLTLPSSASLVPKPAVAVTDYRISVKTSDRVGAGTDANVFILLFGTNGDSGDLHLEKSETNTNPFERNKEDVFTVKGILSLGEVSRLRVWHDNKGEWSRLNKAPSGLQTVTAKTPSLVSTGTGTRTAFRLANSLSHSTERKLRINYVHTNGWFEDESHIQS